MTVDNYIKNWILTRVNKRNQNCIIFVVGPTGSGKSWASMTMATELNENFSINNVIFSREDFITSVQANDPVVVLDEAGAWIGAREWQTEMNRFLGRVTQMVRFKNQVIFLTVPAHTLVDVQVRSLAHLEIEMKYIDYDHKVSLAKPFILETNPRYGKTYMKYPIVNGKKLRRLYIPKPNDTLIEAYEIKKSKYFDSIIKKEDNNKKEKKNKNSGWKTNVTVKMRELGYTNKQIGDVIGTDAHGASDLYSRANAKQKGITKKVEKKPDPSALTLT